MKLRRRILLVMVTACCLLVGTVHAADFWLFGMLPPPQDTATGVHQIKFAYLRPWDGSTWWSNDGTSQKGAEPRAALPVRVVEGRFLLKLPIKHDSEVDSEFLVRVWASPGAAAFTQLTPDWRLVRAEISTGKNVPPPAEITVRGAVFSSSTQKSTPVVLGSSHPSRIALKWKAAAGGFDYEMSNAAAITPDGSGRVLLSSHLHCARAKISHSGLRLPFEGLRKGGLTPDMLGKNMQSNTTYLASLASADAYGQPRQWEDVNGRKLTATFCDSDGAVVILKGADGNLMLLALKSLAPAHHAFVNSLSAP